MYSSSRRYRKNDWWDFIKVIDQELERNENFETYYNLIDELKWRIVESISEGGNFKIRVKARELKEKFDKFYSKNDNGDESKLLEINSIFDFILIKPKGKL